MFSKREAYIPSREYLCCHAFLMECLKSLDYRWIFNTYNRIIIEIKKKEIIISQNKDIRPLFFLWIKPAKECNGSNVMG